MSVSVTTTLAKSVQDALVARLQSRSSLAGVTIVGRRRLNIISDIATVVAKAGLCVYVFPALPVRLNANNPGPYVDRLMVRVRAIEHPTLNRTGPDVYELVELLLREMDELVLEGIDGLNPLRFEDSPVVPIDDDEVLQFDVVAYTSCGLTPRSE